MSIINRRNAILGWGVWTVGKAQAKRKAKQKFTRDDSGSGKRVAAAAASGLAAAGGALWFWRRRSGDGDET
jgi:hypothetical protein